MEEELETIEWLKGEKGKDERGKQGLMSKVESWRSSKVKARSRV